MKLSKNDLAILKLLIVDGRISASEIGRRLSLSSQGAGKIIQRLQKEGVIRGFSTDIDYSAIGITVFAVALFRFKSGAWSRLEKEDIQKRVKGPHLIRFYRFSEGDVTHMVVYGFRSLKELDNYFHVLQTERGHISELMKLYVLSSESVLKDSPSELYLELIKEYGSEKLARPESPAKEHEYP
ncbi:MAG: Lrp/AsnC family transcriptional regulator [Candidatus Altiarchaeota archaeon]